MRNGDETALFWQSLPRNTQAFCHDIEEWFDDNDAEPGSQILSTEEIAEAVLGGTPDG